MTSKRYYLTAIILFSLILPMTVVPALAEDPSIRPDDSVNEDWIGAEPQYDPDWPPAFPMPCEGINHFDDKHDSIGSNVPNVLRAFGPWVPSSDIMVTRIEFIFRGGTNFSLGIWSDDGGAPGKPSTALAYTEYFQVSPVVSWQGADLIEPLPVQAGRKYWIVIHHIDTMWLGMVSNPSPPYVNTTNYYSILGDITGGALWFNDSSPLGYKVRIYCGPPVGGNLQPLSNSFEVVRWATIPIITLIALTVYATYHRKTGILQ